MRKCKKFSKIENQEWMSSKKYEFYQEIWLFLGFFNDLINKFIHMECTGTDMGVFQNRKMNPSLEEIFFTSQKVKISSLTMTVAYFILKLHKMIFVAVLWQLFLKFSEFGIFLNKNAFNNAHMFTDWQL